MESFMDALIRRFWIFIVGAIITVLVLTLATMVVCAQPSPHPIPDLAEDIGVVDVGGYYIGEEVETVLQEIGAKIINTSCLASGPSWYDDLVGTNYICSDGIEKISFAYSVSIDTRITTGADTRVTTSGDTRITR